MIRKLSIVFLLSVAMNSYAQSPGGGNPPLPPVAKTTRDAVNELIGGYGTSIGYQAMLWPTYDVTQDSAAAIQLPQADKYIKDTSKTNINDILTNFILSPSDITKHQSKIPAFSAVGLGSQSMQDAIARLPGSDFALKGSAPNDDPFSFASLIDPVEYTDPQSASSSNSLFGFGQKQPGANNYGTTGAAQNFIAVVTNLGGQPLVTGTSGEQKDTLDKVNFARFVNLYRGYAASESIALSNLEYLFAQRYRDTTDHLGYKAGLTKDPNSKDADASPLKVDHYLATKRLNPQWYANMETSTPIQVQRETLYVLAEMRYELYQMRRDNERIIAALTALQLNTNLYNRENIIKPAHDQIGQAPPSSAPPTAEQIKSIVHK